VSLSAKICAAFSLLLTGVLGGIHPHNLLTKQFFNGLFDLNFIGVGSDPENILVVPFPQQTGLFGE